ncbi:hypothetical protein ACFPH6_05340 [Streptomyces xiangluensis]|uniref:Uncharacterized protein n=1 Tax=Streptomyces xiangluensis TaxID=2665720 RepID=A0ABV8YI79_9ACTN
MELRIDKWIKTPTSAEELTEYIGKHMVAHILTATPPDDKAGGQLIGIDPEKKTASLRRYDNGDVREFPWNTTHFRYTTFIESPFTDLKVGEERRFEWFEDATGMPLETPATFTGTVRRRTPETAYLWVTDPKYRAGGWQAEIKAENADRHALRPLKPSAEHRTEHDKNQGGASMADLDRHEPGSPAGACADCGKPLIWDRSGQRAHDESGEYICAATRSTHRISSGST